MTKKIILTTHILKRFVERFDHSAKQEAKCLDNMDCCIHCRRLIRELKTRINEIFNECKETKSYLNNTQGLMYLYDTYGYEHNFHFYHNQLIMFVTVTHKVNEFMGITCYDIKHNKHIFGDICHKKWNKKKK